MLDKTFSLYYKNGRWYIRNYSRALKRGGKRKIVAKFVAYFRNRNGETPIIDLKRIVPRPWAKEEYGPEVETITAPEQRSPEDILSLIAK